MKVIVVYRSTSTMSNADVLQEDVHENADSVEIKDGIYSVYNGVKTFRYGVA